MSKRDDEWLDEFSLIRSRTGLAGARYATEYIKFFLRSACEDIVCESNPDIPARQYAAWSMSFVDLLEEELEPDIFAKIIQAYDKMDAERLKKRGDNQTGPAAG